MAAILDGTTKSIIELVRDIWMSNACVKFEERSVNPSKLSRWQRNCDAAEADVAVRRRRCWRKHNIPGNLRFSEI